MSQFTFAYEISTDASTPDSQRFRDPDADIDDDDDNSVLGGAAFGQSHRAKLQAEARAGNLQEEIDVPPPHKGNKNKGRHGNQERAGRSILQPKSRATVPKAHVPAQKMPAMAQGGPSGTRGPSNPLYGRSTP